VRDTKDNFQKFILSNGLTVLLYHMDSVMSTSAILFVRTGAVFEKEKERGISHLVEHSAFIGTQKYPSSEIISKTAENLGIFYGGGTSKDSTYYTIKAPHMNFRTGLELLSQFLFAPLLQEQQIVKEKEAILSEYGDFWNDPVRRFEHEIWRKRFSEDDHPYSWRPMGKPETIKNLNLKLVLDWREKYYYPANMILSIAGNFESEQLKDTIQELFGQGETKSPQEEPKFSQDGYSGFTIYHQDDERRQITFNLTFPAFGSREVDRTERIKLRLLDIILGSARSSRLYMRLREKERLIYRMFCERRLLSWMGALVIEGSTPVEKLTKTLSAVKEEIDNLLEKGINEEELNLAKNLSAAQALMQFDNTSEIANYFANESFYEQEIWFPERRIEVINKIRASELNELARKIFNFSKLNLGLLGNISPANLKEVKNIFEPLK